MLALTLLVDSWEFFISYNFLNQSAGGVRKEPPQSHFRSVLKRTNAKNLPVASNSMSCTPSNVDALVTFDNLPEKKRMDLVRL